MPPILSLLCRELNERRFASPTGTPDAQITFRESDAAIETIIAAFYERCLAGRPEAVRIFIEEELVSYSGARLAQDEQSILRLFEHGCEIPGAPDHRRAKGFGEPQAARACLHELVSRRLFSPLAEKRYELIHDLLASVVEKSRTARNERADKEEAGRRAERERKAKWTAVGLAVLFAVLALVAVFQWQETSRARAKAQKAQEQADNRLKLMSDGARIRRAIYSGDQAVLGDLRVTGRLNKTIQFVVRRDPVGQSTKTGRPLFTWSLTPDLQSISQDSPVESMTYRMDHSTFEQKLYAAGRETEFKATYIGWGCLRRVSVLIEYSNPEVLPEVAEFDGCAFKP